MRIAGASGIYAEKQYENGYFEKLPYNQHALKSIYRIRQYDIRKLSLLTNPHIFLSHDWPQGITEHGDLAALLKDKPAFTSEIADGTFGAPPLMDLLKALQPEWWFAAHMHALFKAAVKHDDSATNFTALDKCLPGRKCLEVSHCPFLAINSANDPLGRSSTYPPMPGSQNSPLTPNGSPSHAPSSRSSTKASPERYFPRNIYLANS